MDEASEKLLKFRELSLDLIRKSILANYIIKKITENTRNDSVSFMKLLVPLCLVMMTVGHWGLSIFNWEQYRRTSCTFCQPFLEDAERISIGFKKAALVSPINGDYRLQTVFSTIVRNDTGKINSSPRVITSPVIKLQVNGLQFQITEERLCLTFLHLFLLRGLKNYLDEFRVTVFLPFSSLCTKSLVLLLKGEASVYFNVIRVDSMTSGVKSV